MLLSAKQEHTFFYGLLCQTEIIVDNWLLHWMFLNNPYSALLYIHCRMCRMWFWPSWFCHFYTVPGIWELTHIRLFYHAQTCCWLSELVIHCFPLYSLVWIGWLPRPIRNWHNWTWKNPASLFERMVIIALIASLKADHGCWLLWSAHCFLLCL